MKRAPILVLLATMGWYFLGQGMSFTMPNLEIHRVSALPLEGEKSAPFFEIMSPLPQGNDQVWLPHLMYRKGPPERFLDQVELFTSANYQKERITFYGRRTNSDFIDRALALLGHENSLSDSLNFYACEHSEAPLCNQFGFWSKAMLRPLFLGKAHELLHEARALYVMDQSSNNAYLLQYQKSADTRKQFTALFLRRTSLFRIDYVADREFRVIDPVQLFRKSFLVDKRSDAIDYLAKNLSEVHIEQDAKNLEPNSLWWPLSLLAANFSVNPSSADTLFHFSGLNALIYKQRSLLPWFDSEAEDLLKGNIQAAEKYVGDINPNSPHLNDIGRLARSLVNFTEDKP